MPDEKENSEVTTQSEIKREKVRVIPIRYIDDFPEHPFKVKDDEEMAKLIESVSLYGVMTPVVARIKEDGRYELISGHRRKFACQKLGIDELPIIVRNMTREEAVISMVDLNLQREHILPSEKAFAYKMKMDAMRKKAGRPVKEVYEENECPVVTNYYAADEVSKDTGDSSRQVFRYIRLTELTPELLEMVDEGRIAFRPAVDLSYLREEEMRDLVETIDSEDSGMIIDNSQPIAQGHLGYFIDSGSGSLCSERILYGKRINYTLCGMDKNPAYNLYSIL